MVRSARMTLAAILAMAILAAVPAHALSVQDFEAKPAKEQAAIITAFVDKMTGDIGRDNPQLARNIHDYFFLNAEGKRFPEGGPEYEQAMREITIREITRREDRLLAQIEEQLREVEKRRKEIDERAIKLHDGRRAYVDGQGRELRDADHDDARLLHQKNPDAAPAQEKVLKPEGKRLPEGLEKIYVELYALDVWAKDGKVDLSKIQIEGVIFKVTKDKFPPQK